GPGSAGVDDGGYAGLEGEVGGNAERTFVRASFRVKPVKRGAAKSGVVVNIDQAGGDEEARSVHDFSGGGGGNVFFDSGDFAARHGDIHDAIKMIGRINDMAAFQEEIVARSLGAGAGENGKEGNKSGDMKDCIC